MEATTDKKKDHGANVKRWREWRGMKQEVLAEQVGMSQANLSYYEKKAKIEQEVLEKLAQALGIPVKAITELDENLPINIITNTFNGEVTGAGAVGSGTNNVENYQPTYNPFDKIAELYNEKDALYERMLKEKESVIKLLQEIVKERK
ncbi:MAG: helix-turn-helix transcriptional regulator [Prevotellaceae bacterium]|jgi:transcriptional regulator with XRE-family HTH domain|nr:helix-turn-helix transcriptional regulator [Prevotellaceae bacterium]